MVLLGGQNRPAEVASPLHSLRDCRGFLSNEGTYVAVAGAPAPSLQIAMTRGKRTASYLSRPNQGELSFIAELLEVGKATPVIDRRYPLREVPEAIRYVGAGHTRGTVVITM
jgi:NADPH:quinone reductase-like Zn-dependent oxidoreductase